MLALRIYTVKPPGTRDLVIPKFPCSIGRSEKNDLQIQDTSISNHHARIEMHPSGAFRLKDLKSTNGIYAHSKKVLELQLKNKMIFYLGNVKIEVLHLKDVPGETKTEVVPFEKPNAGNSFASAPKPLVYEDERLKSSAPTELKAYVQANLVHPSHVPPLSNISNKKPIPKPSFTKTEFFIGSLFLLLSFLPAAWPYSGLQFGIKATSPLLLYSLAAALVALPLVFISRFFSNSSSFLKTHFSLTVFFILAFGIYLLFTPLLMFLIFNLDSAQFGVWLPILFFSLGLFAFLYFLIPRISPAVSTLKRFLPSLTVALLVFCFFVIYGVKMDATGYFHFTGIISVPLRDFNAQNRSLASFNALLDQSFEKIQKERQRARHPTKAETGAE